MKKINLLFSTLVVALALLVLGAAIVTPVMQAQSLALQTASNGNGELVGEILFDELGRYAVAKADLTAGKTFKFFGHDWRLVMVHGDTATFWMADPYTVAAFNQNSRSAAGIYPEGDNVWCNGYTSTIWKSVYTTDKENGQIVLAQSDIRSFLAEEAKNMLDDKKYAKYVDKVIPGYVPGNNESNESAQHLVTYLGYSKNSPSDHVKLTSPINQLTADWSLANDRIWLPSYGDLKVWGVVNDANLVVKPNTLKWTETTIANSAWLRTADPDESYYAMTISYQMVKNAGESEATYFHYRDVNQTAGVRPAIHLSIAEIDAEYEDHINHPDGTKNWWDDDWLKVLFMTVCILGVVGLILVVVAVIIKVRRTRQTHEA